MDYCGCVGGAYSAGACTGATAACSSADACGAQAMGCLRSAAISGTQGSLTLTTACVAWSQALVNAAQAALTAADGQFTSTVAYRSCASTACNATVGAFGSCASSADRVCEYSSLRRLSPSSAYAKAAVGANDASILYRYNTTFNTPTFAAYNALSTAQKGDVAGALQSGMSSQLGTPVNSGEFTAGPNGNLVWQYTSAVAQSDAETRALLTNNSNYVNAQFPQDASWLQTANFVSPSAQFSVPVLNVWISAVSQTGAGGSNPVPVALLTQAPGVTPQPVVATSATKTVTTTMSFPGDYCSAIGFGSSNSFQYGAVASALGIDLSRLLGYLVVVSRLQCGSLIADVAAVVNANDNATVAALRHNLQAINTNPSTAWLAAANGVLSGLGAPALAAPVVAIPKVVNTMGYNVTQVPQFPGGFQISSATVSSLTVLAGIWIVVSSLM